MKGRGTRTINNDSLQLVSKTAQAKTHFIIVDAVGVTKSKKTDSRPLERQHGVALKDLLGAVTMGGQRKTSFYPWPIVSFVWINRSAIKKKRPC
jgi:type I site-specific restriction endonuclease